MTQDRAQAFADTTIARLLCAHAKLFGFGGPPLVYMGDELGLSNDRAYALDPEHADDDRWLHRPRMPWSGSRSSRPLS